VVSREDAFAAAEEKHSPATLDPGCGARGAIAALAGSIYPALGQVAPRRSLLRRLLARVG
jgi:hypothetical protein